MIYHIVCVLVCELKHEYDKQEQINKLYNISAQWPTRK